MYRAENAIEDGPPIPEGYFLRVKHARTMVGPRVIVELRKQGRWFSFEVSSAKSFLIEGEDVPFRVSQLAWKTYRDFSERQGYEAQAREAKRFEGDHR